MRNETIFRSDGTGTRSQDAIMNARRISAILPYRARGERFPVDAGLVPILMHSPDVAGAANVPAKILVVALPDEVGLTQAVLEIFPRTGRRHGWRMSRMLLGAPANLERPGAAGPARA